MDRNVLWKCLYFDRHFTESLAFLRLRRRLLPCPGRQRRRLRRQSRRCRRLPLHPTGEWAEPAAPPGWAGLIRTPAEARRNVGRAFVTCPDRTRPTGSRRRRATGTSCPTAACLWSGSRWASFQPVWQRKAALWRKTKQFSGRADAGGVFQTGLVDLDTGFGNILLKRTATFLAVVQSVACQSNQGHLEWLIRI